MRVYKVTASKVDYDTYDSIALVVNEPEMAKLIARKSYFGEWQEPLTVEEVDLSKPHVILTSFNAG